MTPPTPSRPEPAFTMDDAVVVVGLLRLVEDVVPPDLRSLSTKVVERVERRLVEADAAPAFESLSTMEAETQRLEQELAKARFVVDVQAKLHALLETLSESADTEPRSRP